MVRPYRLRYFKLCKRLNFTKRNSLIYCKVSLLPIQLNCSQKEEILQKATIRKNKTQQSYKAQGEHADISEFRKSDMKW